MRMFLSKNAFRRCPGGIIVNRNPRLLESQRDIRLGHPKHGDARERLVLDQQVENGIDRVLVPEFRDFSQCLALQCLSSIILSPPNGNVKMSPHETGDIHVESEGTTASERK